MSDYEEANVETGELTSKMTCSSARKSGYILIKGRPCKIVELSSSNTGKHGHSKVHLVALDIFTGKKLEDVVPSTHEVEVPHISRTEYKLNGIDGGKLQLSDNQGNNKDDVALPEGEIGQQIVDSVEKGDSLFVTIMKAMNEEACISYRNA
ncbi:hypothetical protein PENSTE_c023G10370 [Penicillium steckii]|uniref:Eukaryotic translation initiation factor 5A n=1 Tax=Penicillium steckii TaxID=303698 RepID=A0A1V6SRU5_9EURO|nr:hypothetical protein PENSTE_c023G10370 [Penicillium steckii]